VRGPGAQDAALVAQAGWESLARSAASRREVVPESPADEGRRLLAIRLDGTPYAIPIESVREIVRLRPMTPVPGAPPAVCGVISLRGDIVEVIDLRVRLGLAVGATGRASRIVTVSAAVGQLAGLLVDAVEEVVIAEPGAFRPATGGESGPVESLCLRGDRFLSLIDLDQVMQIDAEH
jgi:purine-binding chemotaxis protein CheW